MASSVEEKDITELQEAGYLAKEIAHRLPAKGQIVPTPSPMRELCFSHTSSTGWDSLFIHLSAD